MMKLRDRAHTPLIAALPAFLFLILFAAGPNRSFGREAPPTPVIETDGGGDEWNDMCPSTPMLSQRWEGHEVPKPISAWTYPMSSLVWTRVIVARSLPDLMLICLSACDFHVQRASEVTAPYNER